MIGFPSDPCLTSFPEVIEAAAPRRLVEKLMVDHEAHISPANPAVLLLFVLEPFIHLAKLAVVEVPSRDGYTIDIAAGLVERVIGSVNPKGRCQPDSHEASRENR